MMKRRTVLIFLAAESIGIICWWAWQYAPSFLAIPMWGTSLILLFPGNFLGGWLVEKIFWRTSLSLVNMSILTTILLMVINAALWVGILKAFKILRAFFSTRSELIR